jgi:CubicO group peptidase (beta-lactamase class C family)
MQTSRPESAGLSTSRLQHISGVMQDYVERGQFAGIITLVARKGLVVHLETFGFQELETRRPMTPETIFRIYSMSKPVTSAAAMMLCEEGRLRLADNVSRYIPEFKELQVLVNRTDGGYDLVPAQREVTVHDLLTHSGGLSYGSDENFVLDGMYRETLQRIDKHRHLTLEKWMQDFVGARLPLAFQPGTNFRYSFSIDVIGYIIQLVSGQPFDEFLRQRIFEPLGMHDTAFWVPPEKLHRLAGIYGPKEEGGLVEIHPEFPKDLTNPASAPLGGGGLVSTTEDYFRFGQMLLNGGELEGVRLLGRKTVEYMMQNHLRPGVHPMGELCNGFGLGGAVLLHPGLSHRPGSIGKFGWGGAANTEWWIDPAEQLNCLIMLQYMPCFTIPIVEDFAQLVYQALE